MRTVRIWLPLLALSVLGNTALLLIAGKSRSVNADTSRPAANIISPKRDGAVGPSHEIVGKMSIAGQPVVLVRPDVEGGEWYVQPNSETNERGYFKSKARFGSDKTARGQRFQIAVVVARTKAEADFFIGKEFVPAIPDALVHSPIISVVLGDAAATEANEPSKKEQDSATAGFLTRPKANESVPSVSQVAGKLRADDVPVVLVRTDERNESWWVQGPIELNKKGEFTCPARFGNEKTPAGQRFRVVVLAVPKTTPANQYSIGKAVAQLPSDVAHSEEVIVTLERPETKN